MEGVWLDPPTHQPTYLPKHFLYCGALLPACICYCALHLCHLRMLACYCHALTHLTTPCGKKSMPLHITLCYTQSCPHQLTLDHHPPPGCSRTWTWPSTACPCCRSG